MITPVDKAQKFKMAAGGTSIAKALLRSLLISLSNAYQVPLVGVLLCSSRT